MHNLKNRTTLFALSFILSLTVFLILIAELFRQYSPLIVVPTVLEAAIMVLILIGLYDVYKRGDVDNYTDNSRIKTQDNDMLSDSENTIAKYDSLIGIIENIESNEPFRDILTFIYNSFSPYIPYSHIGVALVDDDGKTIRAAYAVSGTQHPHLAKRLMGYKTEFSNTSLMSIALNR